MFLNHTHYLGVITIFLINTFIKQEHICFTVKTYPYKRFPFQSFWTFYSKNPEKMYHGFHKYVFNIDNNTPNQQLEWFLKYHETLKALKWNLLWKISFAFTEYTKVLKYKTIY